MSKDEFLEANPYAVWMTFTRDIGDKFYNIELQNNAVLIHYGAEGKTSTTQELEFDTIEEAHEKYTKKVLSKLAGGYTITHSV